jgi:hypothetical protein
VGAVLGVAKPTARAPGLLVDAVGQYLDDHPSATADLGSRRRRLRRAAQGLPDVARTDRRGSNLDEDLVGVGLRAQNFLNPKAR